LCFSIETKNVKIALTQLEKIKEKFDCKIKFDSDIGLIGIVGERMKKTPGVAGKLFTCLGNNNINIELISQGASEINITIIVKEDDVKKAVEIIHDEFELGE
jgi:aspartokinase